MMEETGNDVREFSHKRVITVDGDEWIVLSAGHTAAGSGALAPGYLEAVTFTRANDPDAPPLEALAQRGCVEMMYDEELVALFRHARPITERVVVRRPLEDSH